MKQQHQSLDQLPLLFEYGIDLNNKLLYLGSTHMSHGNESGVDFRMAERAFKGLLYLDNLPTPKKAKPQPIRIVLNTPGGDVTQGLAIYDAIKSCETQTNMYVFGSAYSMGAVLLQAADKRYMAPHSTLMMHYGMGGGYDHPKIMDRWNSERKRVNSFMEHLFWDKMRAKNPGITLKRVQRMLDFDTIFTAHEAVDMGLADAVMDIPKR